MRYRVDSAVMINKLLQCNWSMSSTIEIYFLYNKRSRTTPYNNYAQFFSYINLLALYIRSTGWWYACDVSPSSCVAVLLISHNVRMIFSRHLTCCVTVYCEAGYFISASGDACQQCAHDTYKNASDYYATSCTPCPDSAPKTGNIASTSVDDCRFGEYSE